MTGGNPDATCHLRSGPRPFASRHPAGRAGDRPVGRRCLAGPFAATDLAAEQLPRVAQIAQDPQAPRVHRPALAAPIPDPSKVVCIGLNYRDHAQETGAAIPNSPIVFNKFSSAVIGPEQPILLPASSQQVDYEAELVVVMGRRAAAVPAAHALEYVAGYTNGHDVSAHDWQFQHNGQQWLLGKTFDTFAPTGPALVTADEVPDPHVLQIRFRRNGTILQDSNTRQLIFSIPQLIAHVSSVATLLPGDLIFTGTPGGVGFAQAPRVSSTWRRLRSRSRRARHPAQPLRGRQSALSRRATFCWNRRRR